MSAVRVCVLGVGRLGSAHARLLAESPAFELIGVHDIDGGRAAEVAGASRTRAFDDAGALLEGADAAVVAVPTMHHHDVAGLALSRGCHLLVEKPLARTLAEADDLVARAAAAERVLCVGHVERFNGILLAADPYIDRPRFIESLRLAPFQPRGTDVTVVLDLMIHDIDLVLALAGAPLAHLHAVGVPVMTSSVDIANARLVFESGTVANITASRVSAKPTRELRLFQRSGYFSLDLANGRGEHLRRVRDVPPTATRIEQLVERVPLEAVPGEPLARELDAFADAIAGKPHRLVTGEAGRDALAIAIRITREIEEFGHVVAQDP